ncbi:hypothetical protein M427DRAFT_410992 [Gonapodya prolifera JEL478]|uniref:Uncharacterized protein n=1 Tax=Gonapodya prolifera (strain JEL478) TaxID=1344416 RepID=A0A139A5M7_GONPJ|nr:hypothetical protein M427DRAFT_410992 [Gonapodya prolifera JEL478]|eukprot:KXS12122.1 hypothetical protein M427DRAFT_410992 [Gonapodya prolifera JEL478]
MQSFVYENHQNTNIASTLLLPNKPRNSTTPLENAVPLLAVHPTLRLNFSVIQPDFGRSVPWCNATGPRIHRGPGLLGQFVLSPLSQRQPGSIPGLHHAHDPGNYRTHGLYVSTALAEPPTMIPLLVRFHLHDRGSLSPPFSRAPFGSWFRSSPLQPINTPSSTGDPTVRGPLQPKPATNSAEIALSRIRAMHFIVRGGVHR